MSEQIEPPPTAEAAAARRAKTALVFVNDRDSQGIIQQCLTDLALVDAEFLGGGVTGAIAALAARPSPRLLIVDIQGIAEPEARIRELANVCDPQTGVIIIGDSNDIRLYRSLKASGVVEYYYKPLVRSLVLQTCQGIISGTAEQLPTRDGKLILVISVRGGSGGTMISVATAAYLAETHNRQVGLVDLDLQYGDTALQLDVAPSHALKEALDHSERVDGLFLERAMIRAGDRLGLLASLEPLTDMPPPNEASVTSLINLLRRRCRYVFVDIPPALATHMPTLLHMPCTILLVSTPSLTCARDVARWLAALGPNSAERTTLLILNKSGADDGLPDEEFVRAVGALPDLTIPFDRKIAAASRLGALGLQKCAALQHALVPLLRQLSGEGTQVAGRTPWWNLWGGS